MNPQPLPTTTLIWPTVDHAIYKVDNALNEDHINSVIKTMRSVKYSTDVHRFSEAEQKRVWGAIKRKAEKLGLYKLGDGTWRKLIGK